MIIYLRRIGGKEMIDYYIYYTFKQRGNSSDGNVNVQIDRPITNIAGVRSLEKQLKDENGFDSVVICRFHRFEEV